MIRMGIVAAALIGGIALGYAQENPQAETPIRFKADELIEYQNENRTLLRGNAEIINADLTIRADEISVFFELNEDETRSLSAIEANGNTWAKNQESVITSQKMTYDHKSQIAVFFNNVVAKQEGSELLGEELEIDLETQIYKMVGPVSGTIGGAP